MNALPAHVLYELRPKIVERRARLEAAARERRTAVMCAEAQWWRCHRRLVADDFAFAGWEVRHLMPGGRLVEHVPPPFAIRGADGLPLYPAAGQEPLPGAGICSGE